MRTIQELRRERKLSQIELAVYSKVAVSTVSLIERGSPCSMRVLLALCKVLDVSPRDVAITIKKRVGQCGWQVVEDPFNVAV
jgi:transcriptional regulator with XRE-family HTH domain